jgi:hypothetical protein
MKRIALWDWLRIDHLWVLAVLIGIFVFVNTHPIQPYDFWFHIATGREIIKTGSIPQQDTFSFTAFGVPYPSNNIYWLAQIVLFGVYQAGGAAWTILFASLLITSAYAIITYLGYQLTRSWRAAAAGALIAAVVGIDNWNVRPQILAYFYTALCICLLWSSQLRNRRYHLVLYPFIILLWANTHGTFFVGLVLVVFWGLNEAWNILSQWKHDSPLHLNALATPALLGISSGLACLVTPQGLSIIQTISNVSGNRYIQDLIIEWQPPDFTGYSGILYVISCLVAGGCLIVNKRQTNLFQVLCFIFFGFLGLRYVRAMIWFGLVISPIVAMGFAKLVNRHPRLEEPLPPSRVIKSINLAILTLMVALAIFSLPWFKQHWPVIQEKRGLIASSTPIEATQFLIDSNLPAPIFHDMGFGSYLTWAAAPGYRVFVDPRIELYPAEVWDDYLKINAAASDWQQLLDQYRIQTLLLYRKDQADLIGKVSKSDIWGQQYQDATAVIYTRR